MRINTILLILILLALDSCKKVPIHEYITFINNSDKDICYSRHAFLDTSILCDFLFHLKAGVVFRDSLSVIGWERRLYNKKLDISFFNSKYCIFNMCDSLYDSIRVIKHLDLSIEDLEKMNWTINYP